MVDLGKKRQLRYLMSMAVLHYQALPCAVFLHLYGNREFGCSTADLYSFGRSVRRSRGSVSRSSPRSIRSTAANLRFANQGPSRRT